MNKNQKSHYNIWYKNIQKVSNPNQVLINTKNYFLAHRKLYILAKTLNINTRYIILILKNLCTLAICDMKTLQNIKMRIEEETI